MDPTAGITLLFIIFDASPMPFIGMKGTPVIP